MRQARCRRGQQRGHVRPASYARFVRVMREELHYLAVQLPEERLAPILELIRGDAASGCRARAAATLERMHGVTGADEELGYLRDGGRG
jgi:hypothetical protein